MKSLVTMGAVVGIVFSCTILPSQNALAATNQIEFGEVVKSVMVKLPKNEKKSSQAGYMLSWENMGEKIFGVSCFMECQGNIQGNVIANGKLFSAKGNKTEFLADGPRGGATSIKFITTFPPTPTTNNMIASLKKAGIVVKKIVCDGDIDFIRENNINVPAGMEWTPPSYYKLSVVGSADALLVGDIFDEDIQKDVVWFYTAISTAKGICTGGVKY